MSIIEKEAMIIDEFSNFDDWMDRYNYLIEMGRSLPLIDVQHKSDSNLIKGCQSRLWLHASFNEGKIIFTADSDAVITKGIATLLIRVLSDETPDAILSTPLDFIDAIGLREHLSPTRSNGLAAMIKQIKMYALAYQVKNIAK